MRAGAPAAGLRPLALSRGAGARVARAAGAARAQEPAAIGGRFLFINQERLLTGSQRGQALLAEEEAARDRLRAEARAIDSAFEAEERELTDAARELDPEEFRAARRRLRRAGGGGAARPGRPLGGAGAGI